MRLGKQMPEVSPGVISAAIFCLAGGFGCKPQTLTIAKLSKKGIHWNDMGKATD